MKSFLPVAGSCLLASGRQTRPAEAASHPSPYLPPYLCSWLPAASSDAWIKSYHFRSCCCVLELPASLGFGLPAHNLPWHKPASQQKPFPLWAPPLSREGGPLHLGWGRSGGSWRRLGRAYMHMCPEWEREGRCVPLALKSLLALQVLPLAL